MVISAIFSILRITSRWSDGRGNEYVGKKGKEATR
jgi:hypothetical protein